MSPSKSTTSAGVTLDTWLASTRRLLSMEQQEEVEIMRKELATLDEKDNPNVLTHLTLARYATGLFGRTVLHLSLPSLHLRQAKPHYFTVGDLVQLRVPKRASACRPLPTGIVSRVDEHAISVAFNTDHDNVEDVDLLALNTITLDRLVNNATFAKLTNALDQMTNCAVGPAQAVLDVIFSDRAPSWTVPFPVIQPFTKGLNPSQIEAIQFALASKDVALIHGPPGTGKTTTVVELILQAVTKYAYKVLVCAPSNVAVDNVLDKLATLCSNVKTPLPFVRLGHPARVLPHTIHYCLDAKIATADGTGIVNDIRHELTALQRQWQKTRDKREKNRVRDHMKANRKEIRVREHKVVAEIVRQSRVVFATNVGAASKLLTDVTFDLVVLDEAAQALEASCWIPLLKATRCVLAGDHLQLPPTIKSKTAAANGLAVTLFDRLTTKVSTQCVVKLLDTQYRMHEKICDWSSRAMYKGKVKTWDAVAKRTLHELPYVRISKDDHVLNATLLLVDTAGCDLEEDDDCDDVSTSVHVSKSNEGEARVVATHVRALLAAGLNEDDVAVITPYNKQVQMLKTLLLESFPKLEIRSVDGFQGCEKEAVVMSLVRSNAARQVGFLADDRRMNVAITRAKRHVALVCDSDTMSSHAFLATLVQHFEDVGELRSAHEFLQDEIVQGSVAKGALPSRGSSNVVAGWKADAKAKAKPSRPIKTRHKEAACRPIIPQDEPQVDSEDKIEAQAELEDHDKTVTLNSVFQLMHSESESSNEEKDEQSLVEWTPSNVEPVNELLKGLQLNRLARHSVPLKHTKTSKLKKRQATPNAVPVQDSQDELAFLTQQATESSKCPNQSPHRCHKIITMFGSVCKFCKLKFCYDHAMPEVHGCGDAVRTFERVAFQQQRKATRGKTLPSDKRKVLEKKLQQTVAAKRANRTTKSKQK